MLVSLYFLNLPYWSGGMLHNTAASGSVCLKCFSPYASLVMHPQGDQGKQQLLSQVLTREQQLECFMRERERSLARKVQQAAMWDPHAQQAQHVHSNHGQQPRQLQQQEAAPMDATVSNITDNISLQQQAGYVRVCGIDLPCKQVEAATVATAGGGHRLVHTAAMQENMLAAALALCQNRPLLLEGPPANPLALLMLTLQRRAIPCKHG